MGDLLYYRLASCNIMDLPTKGSEMSDFGVGSFIAVNRRGAGVSIYKVIGETATQWKTEGDLRFRKNDFSIIGETGKWDAKHGRPAIEADFIAKRIIAANHALSLFVVTPENLTMVELLISRKNDAFIGNG